MNADAPAGETLLCARGLRAGYGKTEALRGLDADVPAGGVLAILGENGSGKSTFLKVVARILPAISGELLFDGSPLASRPRRETARRIAYVPQSVDLVFPIRALDLVLQGRAPRSRSFSADSAEDRARALEAMRACDVEDLAERDASALSGGETRRVFLARALAQEAEVWLLDEPTAGLDPRHRLEFLDVLRRTHAEKGGTILLVTHELGLAAEIADRVLLLRHGRALASGPPAAALSAENLRRAFDVEFRVGGSGFQVVGPVPGRAGVSSKPGSPTTYVSRSLRRRAAPASMAAFSMAWFRKVREPEGAARASREQGPRGPLGQVRQLPADPLQQGARAQLQDLPQVRLPLPPLRTRAPADALRRRGVRGARRRPALDRPAAVPRHEAVPRPAEGVRGVGRHLRRHRDRRRARSRRSRSSSARWSSSSSAARWARSSARR